MKVFAIREDLVLGLLNYLTKRPMEEVETAVLTLRSLQEVQLESRAGANGAEKKTVTPDVTPSGPAKQEAVQKSH